MDPNEILDIFRNRWFNTHLEIVQDRLERLEPEEEQDDNEEEEVDDNEEEVQLLEEMERERVEQNAEKMVKTFIRKSSEVLDNMEKDTKKMRKNACQKDIKETNVFATLEQDRN